MFMSKVALAARRLAADHMRLTFILLGVVLAFFIGFPLFKMVISTSPGKLLETLSINEVSGSILLTVYCGLLATAIGFLLGVPLAYLLARYSFPGKRMVEGLVDIPVVVPHSAAGIALLFVFGQRFFLGRVFHSLGIDFVGEIAGIVVAMLFVSIPFLVNSAKEGFRSVDVRLEKVARTLGASPWQTFLRISMPLAWGSILSGSIMMWARGISEFGAVLILTYHPMIAPILVYEWFEKFGLEYARPVAVLLILICLVVFAVLRTVIYRREPT